MTNRFAARAVIAGLSPLPILGFVIFAIPMALTSRGPLGGAYAVIGLAMAALGVAAVAMHRLLFPQRLVAFSLGAALSSLPQAGDGSASRTSR